MCLPNFQVSGRYSKTNNYYLKIEIPPGPHSDVVKKAFCKSSEHAVAYVVQGTETVHVLVKHCICVDIQLGSLITSN